MEKEVATHSSILDVRVWKAPVHRAAKSWTGLSNQTAILYSIVLSTWKLKENSPWVFLFPLREYVQIYMFLHIRSEKAMAPHSSTLAWKIPWAEEPGRLQSMGSLRVGHDWATSLSLSCIGEGNGNPLQCSCLENPRDRGAWWVAIYGVAQNRTRLKWLSSSSST